MCAIHSLPSPNLSKDSKAHNIRVLRYHPMERWEQAMICNLLPHNNPHKFK
eukprot:c37432_g1_i1 orf=93-245(-)